VSDHTFTCLLAVIGVLVGLVIGFVIPLPQYGTSNQNQAVQTVVNDLTIQGYYMVEQPAIGIPRWANYQPQNLTTFLQIAEEHHITKLDWSFGGSLGPKIWMLIDGIYYYWSPEK
jgi:type III secretory pathway component EscS